MRLGPRDVHRRDRAEVQALDLEEVQKLIGKGWIFRDRGDRNSSEISSLRPRLEDATTQPRVVS